VNPRVLLSVLPVAAFYFASRWFGATPAILAGFVTFVGVYFANRRDGLIGVLTAFGFVVVTVSAVIGLIWNSEKAYLASGPVFDFLLIPLHLGSLVIRKPLVGAIARELFPFLKPRIPINHPVFFGVTIAWACFDVFQGVVRGWMLHELSVGEYIIWSRVVGWPVSTALFLATVYFVFRAARGPGETWRGMLRSAGAPPPMTIPPGTRTTGHATD
jgi:hypothetical protein